MNYVRSSLPNGVCLKKYYLCAVVAAKKVLKQSNNLSLRSCNNLNVCQLFSVSATTL
jgi:hypothetical protein